MTPDSDIVLPPRIVGPSLTVAGFAAWVFAHAGREQQAEQCAELQGLLDSQLRHRAEEVRVPRPVASQAVSLWVEASTVADTWATTEGKTSAEWGRHAERLRIRAQDLRRLLGSSP